MLNLNGRKQFLTILRIQVAEIQTRDRKKDDNDSPAAKYAKAYSARMNQKQNRQVTMHRLIFK